MLAYSILYFVVDRHTVNIKAGPCLLADFFFFFQSGGKEKREITRNRKNENDRAFGGIGTVGNGSTEGPAHQENLNDQKRL